MEGTIKNVRWGILGTGRIAGVFAQGLVDSKIGELTAVGSRTAESAEQFGEKYGVGRRHDSYGALLADHDVEAVYIAIPHPMHARWAIAAAEAGKHVLCEKPLSLNYWEAMAVVEAARENDVFLMEAFMFRCHPQTEKLVELIRDGAIGELRAVQATFSIRSDYSPESRLYSQELGGGGILDLGCYCASMARLLAGAAVGKDFEDPVEVKAAAHIGQSRVDECATAAVRFPSGIIATLETGIRVRQENDVRAYGTDGWIWVPQPWRVGREGKILLHRNGGDPEMIAVPADADIYALEAGTVARNLSQRQATPPAPTWADSLSNMKTLDAWRESIGLVYDSEIIEAQVSPLARRPLHVRPDSKMQYGHLSGVEKPIARLVMGVATQQTMPEASVMFDHYFGLGGNCFDTAHLYAGGLRERLFGNWLKTRGLREQVVIIAKGAHTPYNFPEQLRPQLLESLERLQTDYADIHFAHRDNPEVPVGEWADAWNELIRDGLIRVYGGSNWELQRVEALNEYARAKGLAGMTAVSNQFSLARMVDPVWGGCLSASDPESRAWLEKTQLPVFAWSSQARRFFTDRARPAEKSDTELVRCWYAEDNFERKQRAEKLAADRGVAPIAVALAYVLCQPFPTFALIGPRALSETRVSFQALEVKLTPREIEWLNLED